jgi:hypothetical protein
MYKAFAFKKFYLLYEGDDDSQNDDSNADDKNQDPNSNPEGGDPNKKTFTQDELNKILANDRRKNEEKAKKIIAELETIKQSKNLTEQEQAALSKRIEELNDQLLTKEQLAKKDREKLQKDYDSKLTNVTTERDTWKARFERALIINAIHKASEEHEAYDTSQIIGLVQAQMSPRVVQEMDESGAPKDIFTPRVKLLDKDSKTGAEVTLDLTISEAVKRMKERPENFNLFKATINGGLGLGAGAGRSDSDAPPLKDAAAYRKWRNKNLK